MEGLRPSFSAHVSWREHGAPVRFCLVRWVLVVLSSGSRNLFSLCHSQNHSKTEFFRSLFSPYPKS
jgi:hypothetical protein